MGSSLLGLLALEIGMRIVSQVSLNPSKNFIQEALDIVRTNSGVMVFDEDIGWRLKDNLKAGGGDNTFTTGAHGVRMNSAEIRPLSQNAILATGDSFAAGSGCSDDGSWPAYLERLTREPVINVAAGAYGVDQMILRAESLIPVLKPRTLVVGILAQDSLRNCFEVYGGGYKPYFVIENGQLVLKGQPVPRLESRPVKIGILRSVFGHSYLIHWAMMRMGKQVWWIHDKYRYQRVHKDEVGVEISCRLMERLAELKINHGIRVIVLMEWGAAEVEAKECPWYGPPVMEAAGKAGLEPMDVRSHLQGILRDHPEEFKKLWLNEGGVLGHMSPRGNEEIARLLFEQFFNKKKA